MKFTIRARDGPEKFTWEDGSLTVFPAILAEFLAIEAETRGSVEFPVKHYVGRPILADPYGACGLILEYLAGRGYDYEGDDLPPLESAPEGAII